VALGKSLGLSQFAATLKSVLALGGSQPGQSPIKVTTAQQSGLAGEMANSRPMPNVRVAERGEVFIMDVSG
jgi:hypothetical protein